jgi:hypothetical protein
VKINKQSLNKGFHGFKDDSAITQGMTMTPARTTMLATALMVRATMRRSCVPAVMATRAFLTMTNSI